LERRNDEDGTTIFEAGCRPCLVSTPGIVSIASALNFGTLAEHQTVAPPRMTSSANEKGAVAFHRTQKETFVEPVGHWPCRLKKSCVFRKPHGLTVA
jgi:hypothetical protein